MKNGKAPGDFMGLKFDNHISAGNLITLLAVGASLITWGNRMEGSIDRTNVRVEAVEKSDTQQNILIESIRNQTSTINTSLARIQERQDSAAANILEIKEILRNETTSPTKRRKAPAEDRP